MKDNTQIVLNNFINKGYVIDTERGKIFNNSGKEIGGNPQKDGYIHVGCMVDGKIYGVCRRQIIWYYANGYYDSDKFSITYNSDDKTNDAISNLKLISRKELASIAAKSSIRKDFSHNSKFSNEQVAKLRDDYREKRYSIRDRAKQLNISHVSLAYMLKGKTYSNVNNISAPVQLAIGPMKTNVDRVKATKRSPSKPRTAEQKAKRSERNKALKTAKNINVVKEKHPVITKVIVADVVKKPTFDIKAMAAKIMAKRAILG